MQSTHLPTLSFQRPVVRRSAAAVLMLAVASVVTWAAVPGRTAVATTATAGVTASHTLVVTAKPGVANVVSVSFAQAASGKVVVRDLAGRVAAAAPCRQGYTPNQAAVVCPLAAVSRVSIDAGDGNDQAAISSARVGRRSYPADIFGGAGNDRLQGSWGSDRLIAGDGNDTLTGGPGNDGLDAGPGDDGANGGDGVDRLYGRAGNDSLDAGPGDDLPVLGEAGDDRLYGREGTDVLDGGDGADRLDGGPGPDRLYGRGGDDRLDGGVGADNLYGGPGSDVVSYETRTAQVVVNIWDPGQFESGDWTLDKGPGEGRPRYDVIREVEGAVGGSGADFFYAEGVNGARNWAGAGDDNVYVSDDDVDTADCGPGDDSARADYQAPGPYDQLVGCEHVYAPIPH